MVLKWLSIKNSQFHFLVPKLGGSQPSFTPALEHPFLTSAHTSTHMPHKQTHTLTFIHA